jgi:aerobic-type carbon monoxide dehydrogenase small subunit (CoxS/CutS family)
MDGLPVKSCLILAVEAIGHEITTVESLKNAPYKKLFVENWNFNAVTVPPDFL